MTRNMRPEYAGLPGVVVVALVLAGCVRGADITGVGVSTAEAIPAYIAEGVVLAYEPVTGSLLKADTTGLQSWQPNTGWQEVESVGQGSLSGLVVVPDQPEFMYVSGPGLGVLRSTDGGAAWESANTGLASLDVTALAGHSYRPDTLFAWVAGVGIFRTEDAGLHWVQMPDPGPTDGTVTFLAHSDLPGSMNTGWLYAATPSGVYLSMDCF